MRPLYPIGIQTFSKIREGDYVYVDKTEAIHRIVGRGGYYFLSRPRRFGKSLTLSTMHSLYRGRRELFDGLWAETGWDWSRPPSPVIWLKFASSGYQSIGLVAAIGKMVDEVAEEYGIDLTEGDYIRRFQELIKKLARRDGKVVLLVDEYDKPIIDVIGNVPELDERRATLKSFYSVLKDADADLELVFITGVSAFAKVSIFSDLNNLTYLTLDERAATLVGITQEELYTVFAEELRAADKEKLREWYNGYSWNGRDFVYNPWSILSYMETGVLKNYWFSTGTPTFLVKIMRREHQFRIPRFEGDEIALTTFNPERVDLLPVLFQTGYLTIKAPSDSLGYYPLDYPNREVRQSLDRMLLEEYISAGPMGGPNKGGRAGGKRTQAD